MIDEDLTMQLFLYTSDELTSGSRKPSVVVCEGCGAPRVVPRRRHKEGDPCKSCATKEYYKHPKAHERHSAAMKNVWANPILREQKSIAQTKRYEDPVEREKQSGAIQGIPYDEWEGFATDSPYCPKFNESCRESNREKYDRRCFLSDMTEDENKQKLSVHHIDMNKAQGCDGHAWKLVPLCKKLHNTSHTPTWTARIIYLLEHVWNPGRNNVVS